MKQWLGTSNSLQMCFCQETYSGYWCSIILQCFLQSLYINTAMDKKRICFNASFQMYVAWTVSIKVYPQCNRKLTKWPSHWHWTAVGPPVHRHPSTLPAAHPQALRYYTPLPPLCKTHLLNKPFSLPRHDCYFTKDFIHSHIIYNILKIFILVILASSLETQNSENVFLHQKSKDNLW